jgi:hypothetical protein
LIAHLDLRADQVHGVAFKRDCGGSFNGHF